jgi:hypothetical protein
MCVEEAEAAVIDEYEAKIAALDQIGPLTMEIDVLKKTPRRRSENASETLSIVTGPMAVLSEGDAIELPRSTYYDLVRLEFPILPRKQPITQYCRYRMSCANLLGYEGCIAAHCPPVDHRH